MNWSQATSVASSETDLEFPRKILGQRMSNKVVGDSQTIGSHVERFGFASARPVAGGDVAYRVATGFAGCELMVGKGL